ncbi:MAG: alpha/beta hydrolase [Phaeodactylibacter sp.]|nr:alpha/beta hydrolase [Phaeodactylibacter sp.]MCB9049391.1 alpha/beta hydrolase [Lewinellaceae bacterium]
MKTEYLWVWALLFISLPGTAQPSPTLHTSKVAKDIVWASPGGFDLTMDIYTPDTGKKKYPVLVIFHGGGWLINNKSIMDQMAQYVAEHGEYVVCNVNYRLLVDNGNTVTMDQIVEDVFGAVLWIKENIKKYKGNKGQVAVTGDSAGGHLASMVTVMGRRLSSTGFAEEPLGFNPTYLPRGRTAEKVARKDGLEVQAAIISYGAFDLYQACLGDFETPSNFFWQMGGAQARRIFGEPFNAEENPERYKAVSPIYHIPKANQRKLPPQLLTVGSKDNLTTPESVKMYRDKLKEAGQPVEYWEYEGRPHAFLDSGANPFLGTSFEQDAPEAIDRMIAFLDSVFY